MARKQIEPPALAYRIPQFCRAIGISTSSFWKYHGLGKIHTVKLGRRVVVPADEAARLLREGIPEAGNAEARRP
jgi:hypothetical protein